MFFPHCVHWILNIILYLFNVGTSSGSELIFMYVWMKEFSKDSVMPAELLLDLLLKQTAVSFIDTLLDQQPINTALHLISPRSAPLHTFCLLAKPNTTLLSFPNSLNLKCILWTLFSGFTVLKLDLMETKCSSSSFGLLLLLFFYFCF